MKDGEDASEIWVEVDGIGVGLVDDARAVIVRGPDGRYVHDHSLCGLLAGHVLDEARFLSWARRFLPLVRRALERGRLAGPRAVNDWAFADDPTAFFRPWFGQINEPATRVDLSAIEHDVLGGRSGRSGPGEAPELTVVMGPVASGKTTLRRSRFASFVPIDPADLYLLLTIGDTKVPANIGRLLQDAGRAVALATLRERRDAVLEVLPSRLADPLLMDLLPRIKALGYRTSVVCCDAPLDVCLRRNRLRAEREISAVHTELDAIEWLRHALGWLEPRIEAARRWIPRGGGQCEVVPRIDPAILGWKRAEPGSCKYELPGVDLLETGPDQLVRRLEAQTAASDENERRLLETLADFGVQGCIAQICFGPVVTRYELEPAPGTNISRIVDRAGDLAALMGVQQVRVVAPIPGTDCVGFEIPNPVRETVYLRELVAGEGFQQSTMALPLAIGEDIEGEFFCADLARMPHLLVAGATGTGTAVALRTVLASILYRATPDQTRLLLIETEPGELQDFDGIPHLLSPVLTDVGKATRALRWTVDEMDRRYRLFAEHAVRDIVQLNTRVDAIRRADADVPAALVAGIRPDSGQGAPDWLPRIVIVIGELADLMEVAARETETAISRLAQKARAAGIHVVLGSQRPSADVITGVIKANFPARIAFRVCSKVDSRTILDEEGAEQLLGDGDMLFMRPGSSGLERVHGALISSEDVERIASFWRNQGTPVFDERILEPRADEAERELDDDVPDELYERAGAIVLTNGRASTAWLQRKLGIGYDRAARLMDRLEREGVVGPPRAAMDREILVGTPAKKRDET